MHGQALFISSRFQDPFVWILGQKDIWKQSAILHVPVSFCAMSLIFSNLEFQAGIIYVQGTSTAVYLFFVSMHASRLPKIEYD